MCQIVATTGRPQNYEISFTHGKAKKIYSAIHSDSAHWEKIPNYLEKKEAKKDTPY
jgi:hypothetical protein